jgi:hypothetical protein
MLFAMALACLAGCSGQDVPTQPAASGFSQPAVEAPSDPGKVAVQRLADNPPVSGSLAGVGDALDEQHALPIPEGIYDGDAREALTIINCFLVRAAVESFALENGGEYPSGLHDCSLAGHVLADLLPGGQLLRNAFTHCATEPVDGSAVCRGQIGYVGTRSNGYVDGYRITACGREPYDGWIVNWILP